MKRRHMKKGVRVRPLRVIDGDGQRELTRDNVLALVNAIVAQAIREVEDVARRAAEAA
ncbi:MAG TPA: hypothetical protein VHJ99_11340 [Candidatus Dormibacteraeota bacterium]|nr:hypothetical protein [Candidatus Dormibacteraeota bacterium]